MEGVGIWVVVVVVVVVVNDVVVVVVAVAVGGGFAATAAFLTSFSLPVCGISLTRFVDSFE